MRKFAVATALVASLALGTQVASAAPDPHVSGSGETSNGTKFKGEAQGTPLDAKGNFSIDFAGVRTKIRIDCVNVVGNTAAISGPITDGQFAGDRGGTLITDNGEGKKDPPDTVYAFLSFPGPFFVEPDCGLYRAPNGVPITKGNFTVKDR